MIYSYRITKGDGRRVVKIELASDSDIEIWEDTLTQHQVLVSVTGRQGRDLLLSNDEICSLDSLILDGAFTPAIGKLFIMLTFCFSYKSFVKSNLSAPETPKLDISGAICVCSPTLLTADRGPIHTYLPCVQNSREISRSLYTRTGRDE